MHEPSNCANTQHLGIAQHGMLKTNAKCPGIRIRHSGRINRSTIGRRLRGGKQRPREISTKSARSDAQCAHRDRSGSNCGLWSLLRTPARCRHCCRARFAQTSGQSWLAGRSHPVVQGCPEALHLRRCSLDKDSHRSENLQTIPSQVTQACSDSKNILLERDH